MANSKLYNWIDRIDRKLYGRRWKLLIWMCLTILIGAPFVDSFLLKDRAGWLTCFSMLILFLFIVIVTTAFANSWRDDNGNWSRTRAFSRVKTYLYMLQDSLSKVRNGAKNHVFLQCGMYLFWFGIIIRTLHNLSISVRKPIEKFAGVRLSVLRHFEKKSEYWGLCLLFLGVTVVFILYKNDKTIAAKIKSELRRLFTWGRAGFDDGVVRLSLDSSNDLVIHSKKEEHIHTMMRVSRSKLFSDFLIAMNTWRPMNLQYEYKYQDDLLRHLSNSMPDANINTEFPIGNVVEDNKGRADVVVNKTLLIELKRDATKSAIQRAQGQLLQYTSIWKDNGPVILLLCDYEFNHAKMVYTPTMSDLLKLKRPALAILAKEKFDSQKKKLPHGHD
jgi:hypothetical protein